MMVAMVAIGDRYSNDQTNSGEMILASKTWGKKTRHGEAFSKKKNAAWLSELGHSWR